jgi:hypothetical protein
MRRKIVFKLAIVVAGLSLTNCSNTKNTATTGSAVLSLKKTFRKSFLIGTALNAEQIEEKREWRYEAGPTTV